MFQQSNQLPVSFDQIDQTTFNGNLPQGNDAVPQLQVSPWLHQNSQIAMYAIGTFRSIAQTACQKTHLHAFGYNLLSQNRFHNQVYQQWCQMVIDLTELLIVTKGYPPQDAVTKAAQRVYEAFLGMAYSTYPQLQQVTPRELQFGLQTAQQIYQSITNDIRQYRNGGMQNMTQMGNSGNLPPINYNQAPQNNFAGAQVGGSYSHQPYQQNSFHQPANNTATIESSLYDVPGQSDQILQPKEELSFDSFGNSVYNQTEQKLMHVSMPEQTDLPIPKDVDSCVVDPTYYQPSGFKLDIERPYDLIWNPGGIEIRPAQLVEWSITVGDDAPYPQLVNPDVYCTFLIKFPDGVIKEKFVEWTNSMNYLRHELDADMRRKAYRPAGIVVSSSVPISTIGGDAIKATDAVSAVEDGHLKRSSLPPVVLEPIFQGSNDLEIEQTIREELENLLNINFSADVPMPAVEYRSQFTYPIQITQEVAEELDKLVSSKDLTQVALGLRQLALEGKLSIRTLRAINDRLTKAVNLTLTDSMALTVQIDDFCEDYVGLEDYLEQKRSSNMRKVLQGAGDSVLKRALQLVEVDSGHEVNNPQIVLVDNYLNHQVGWTLDELASLNIKSGKAVLVSAAAHPTIIETLRGMISRANAEADVFVGTLRIVTADGYYLELIKGRLVNGATLLKLVK